MVPFAIATSSVPQRDDSVTAFASQFDGMVSHMPIMMKKRKISDGYLLEVDRAVDNLVKSGKLWPVPRRDSMSFMMNRPPYTDYGMDHCSYNVCCCRCMLTNQTDHRAAAAMGIPPHPQRHHPVSEFDAARAPPPPNTNLQGFYAAQRLQSRPNEVDQMMQAKRRMAAQRERELRNYHQEQQYNRSTW